MPWIADRRLYRTADDQVVEEGDERAAFLLVGEGGTVDDETVARYGLAGKAKPDQKAQATPANNKAVAKAPANKST